MTESRRFEGQPPARRPALEAAAELSEGVHGSLGIAGQPSSACYRSAASRPTTIEL
ncbi:hypothetical protein Ait01nite_026330 [Actinoplanes italicus]|nr:hypothetical protein Ait01nite_026330 [Actinoplanes italicus]